jgi:hypothetical protein
MAELHQEKVVHVARPEKHFLFLRAPNGQFLGVDDDSLGLYSDADDGVIWDKSEDGYRHVVTGTDLASAPAESGCKLMFRGETLGEDGKVSDEAAIFRAGHGPADLPSSYLKTLSSNGWVCIPCVLNPEIVEALEQVACTDRFEERTFDPSRQPLLQHIAVAQTATEPVSLWLMRQYMGRHDIRFGHPPSLAIVAEDDGKRDVQGWHSDFPYLWGIAGPAGNRIPEHSLQELVLGVQRNICISDFTKENGATVFKLGTHNRGEGPPKSWGNGNTYGQPGYREAHGLPYNGPDAEVVEAPGGSIILYDARTWHRAGINRMPQKRAAMLQAVIPSYMMPFFDSSRVYREFIDSPLMDQLDDHEKRELDATMVNRMGWIPITVDVDLMKRGKVDTTNGGY